MDNPMENDDYYILHAYQAIYKHFVHTCTHYVLLYKHTLNISALYVHIVAFSHIDY